MPPAIIGGLIALGASGLAAASIISVTTALIIGMAATVAGSLLTPKPKMPGMGDYTSMQERKQILRSSTAPCNVIYGTTMLSGVLIFAEEEEGDQDDGEWLYMVLVLAAHKINRIKVFYVGDETVGSYGANVEYALLNDLTTADPYLVRNCPSWTDDMVGRGVAMVRIGLKYDQELFPAGLPNLKFEVEGKLVWDPRTNNTIYSNNAAICILDYYLNYLKVPKEDINLNEFIAAANICDEQVLDADGSYSKRYTVNGTFDVSETCNDILDSLFQACGGEPTYIGGKHGMMVAAYYGPAAANMVLDESCIRDDIKITPEASYKDLTNIIRGVYIDPTQNYTETDFPPVVIEEWIQQDGKELPEDFKYRFVTNAYTAQRLARILINRKRVSRMMEIPVNMKGFKFRPGKFVKVNLPQLGISNIEFRVTKWDFDPTNGITIALREESAATYGDSVGEVVVPPPITNIKPEYVKAPVDIRYEVDTMGEIIQGVLYWTNPQEVAYNNVIVYGSDGKVKLTIQVPGQFTRLNGLPKDDYSVLIYAVSFTGIRSSGSGYSFSIAAPNPPTGVEVENGYFSLTLKPRSNNANDVQYDFWTSGKVALPNVETETVEAGADRLGVGQMWLQNSLEYMTTYYFYIRCTNIYGASAFIQVEGTVSTDLNDFWDQLDDKWTSSNPAQNVINRIQGLEEALAESGAHQDWQTQYSFKQNEVFKTAILRIDKNVIEQGKAFSESLVKLETSTEGKLAALDERMTTVIDEEMGVMSQKITNMEVQFGQDIAQLKQELKTVFDKDGTGYSMYDLRVGINYNGKYYGAGQQVYANVDSAGKVTTGISFVADSFMIATTANGVPQTVFYVQDGKVYLKDVIASKLRVDWAQIDNVVINSAQITGDLTSKNFVNTVSGWAMKQNGEIQINGGGSGTGRMRIINDQLLVWDEQGRLRVEIGRLS